MALSTIGWIDATLLAVLALSVLIGLWRGFTFELMSLAGWVVAWLGAQHLSAPLTAWLPIGPMPEPGAAPSALRLAAAMALAFVGVMVVWGLLARLVRALIQATPLTVVDRLLGAGFGLLRGGVLLLVVATLVWMTPAARAQPWQDSRGAAWLGLTLQQLRPWLPEAITRHLPSPAPRIPPQAGLADRPASVSSFGVTSPCAASSASSRARRSTS